MACNLIAAAMQPTGPKETVMTKLRTTVLGTAVLATLLASSSGAFAEGTAEQARRLHW